MSMTPIADYALLSDRHCAALVNRSGSVDWLCLPRFDSPAVFARLLDADAGHFSIRPAGDSSATRRYLDATLVLQTTFDTPTGTLVVTDVLATGAAEDPHRHGAAAPRLLIRAVECTDGEVSAERLTDERGLVFRYRTSGGASELDGLTGAEEVDANTGELLGNVPQAFSHLGLINAAWAISEASGDH